MKKFLAFILLALFIYQIIGFVPVFLMERMIVRKEIKKMIKASVPQHELTVFHFTEAEFDALQWVKPGKEFILNDKMFDIVRKSESSGNITVHVINDTQERQLFADLDDQVNRQADSSPSSEAGIKLCKLFNSAIHESCGANITPGFTYIESNSFPFVENFASISSPIDIPPPENC